MKPILYIGLAASLALGACSSTYKTAQTPDDVYYSPRQQPQTYATSNGSNGNSVQDENATYVQGADEEEGNYVTYQDDQGDYERRINRFGSSGSSYSGDYWDGYNAASNLYLSSGFGLGYGGFGLGYSPFSSFYGPSLGFGLGWGIGGYYSPWSPYYGGWGYPYIGSYWPSYYYPYYGGGYYGGGYYGHGAYGYHSRPANAYGPVRASGERVARPAYTRDGTTGSGYTRPTRSGTVQPADGRNGGFTRPSSTSERPRRIFQQSNSESPVVRPSSTTRPATNNNNNTYTRPQRVEYSRPAPTPAPSYTPSRSSGGSSGGGGGYSRPSRGGR